MKISGCLVLPIAAMAMSALLTAPVMAVQPHRVTPAGMLARTETIVQRTARDVSSAGQVNVSSRAYNLCVRYDGAILLAYKCTGGQTDETWLILDTGSTGRYALKNVATSLCLTSSGMTLAVAACDPSSSTNWWTFAEVADTNGNQYTVNNAAGYCLANNDIDGYSGSLSLAECNPSYWTQQWKLIGSPEVERTGSTAAGPWIGHANYCTNYDYADRSCGFEDGKWLLSNGCEDNFGPVRGGAGCLHPADTCGLGGRCMWQRGFQPISGTSTYQFTQALDKINYADPELDNAYVFAAMIDPLEATLVGGANDRYLNDEYVLEVRFQLNQDEMATSPVAGHARLMIGIQATNYEDPAVPKYLFVEVVIWRDSDWYDLCTATENRGGGGVSSPCDTAGVYDRRSAWDYTDPLGVRYVGEQVWYTGSALNLVPNARASIQVAPTAGEGWYTYQIPVTELFTKYQWNSTNQPSNWANVRIEDLYFGVEEWGRARVWADVDDYRFYKVERW